MKAERDDLDILAVGLGKVFHRSRYKYFTVPYPRYDRWGFITGRNSVLIFLWYLPLFVIGNLIILWKRPRFIIGNGFASVAGLMLAKPLGCRLIITHQVKGSFVGMSGLPKRIFDKSLSSADLIVANSEGCARDLHGLVPEENLLTLELWADDLFFEDPVEKAEQDILTLLYVGRMDDPKFCFSAVDLAREFAGRQGIKFVFAGVGKYSSEIKRLSQTTSNIEYAGYVRDRKLLKELYRRADVVWAYADETYLGLPAIEALACGRPIIVPKYAIMTFKERRDPVDEALVPPDIGWLVDPFDLEATKVLVSGLISEGIDDSMRQVCRSLALEKYSRSNIRTFLDKIGSRL
jgi:glycosyltransferase involved in cell wall biosynthesis